MDIIYRPFCGGVYDLSGQASMGLSRGELGSWEFKRNKAQQLTLLKGESVAQAALSCLYPARYKMDSLLDACDIDAMNGTPGILTYGGWSIECFIKAGAEEFYSKNGIKYDVELLAPDPTWWKEYVWHFTPSDNHRVLENLDFDYDLPVDYGVSPDLKEIKVPTQKACPVRIIVYGETHNPAIRIGNNKYEVKCNVPQGTYLVIDGTPNNLGVKLLNEDSEEEDMFSQATRGVGKNSGEYIFQRVPPGTSQISWDNSFAFDVIVRDERGRLPWRVN